MYRARLFVFFISTVVIMSSAVQAATYLDITDDIYAIFSRLEAEGVITSALLNTKPISRSEAKRLLLEAEQNSTGSTPFIKDLVQSLRERLKPGQSDGAVMRPLDTLYGTFVHTTADAHSFGYNNTIQPLNYNNDGDVYGRGANYRVGFTSRMEDLGPFSFYLNPEYKASDNIENEFIARKAYAVYDFGWDLIVGKDSGWWGPGYHGALLLTNNAEPFTMLKLTNPSPVVLPWIFKHLGPFQFTFFATNLEKDRSIPEPYLWGMRFDFKPHPNLELGLERTAIIGGRKGRPEDTGIWLRSMFGLNNIDNKGGSREPGDQRAGFDLKWTIPSTMQPAQIYLEADGEDENHNLPNLWAFVGGVYLPRVLSVERVDFRLEYATTRGRINTPVIWYVHSIYESYTYNDRVLGHHMGTDSKDIFAEVSYHVPERSGRLFVSYDGETRNLLGAGSSEKNHEATAGLDMALNDHIRLTASYGKAWTRNIDNTPRETIEANKLTGQVTYAY